jgi:crotonobetainyl-CoA:carnitine CoA-transferase CaiB-like acyl-CoA transferase
MLLNGLKIVSFCHFLQGPAAMQYLGDMGADVVKIEPPNGAFERHWAGANGAQIAGVSAFFLCANRNARSIALDLKHPESKDVVFRLIDQSQVVAENFRPGALERLGFGYQAVRQRKSNIIYASASGFGSSGPFSKRPGQDLLAQAMSGLISAQGADGERTAVGCAAVDQHGAALFALGIAGAYARLLSTGVGTHVEATLLGAGLDLQVESVVTYHASKLGNEAFDHDRRLASWYHEAPYGVYKAKDCQVALSLNQIGNLADALDSASLRALADRNAYHERDILAQAVAEEIQLRPFSQLEAVFDAKGVWYARVENYDDLLENPQLAHNGAFINVPVNGEMAKLVGHPLRYDGKASEIRGFALTPGADTHAVLEEAGYSGAEIAELLRNKVAFGAKEAEAA